MSIESFITKWSELGSKGGKERANLQLFVTDLCSVMEVEPPHPSKGDNSSNAYVFERSITETFLDGEKTNRSIDCYKRGCFVLEGKDTGKSSESLSWDKAIRKAHGQASNYVRNLPVDESRPPFIIIVDVGVSISLYSEFTRTGGSYVAYPDQQNYKIPLTNLIKPEVLELLKTVWLNPMSLDPSKISARVTRKIAANLGDLAKSLESKGHAPQVVASFLMRSLFSMFAEDVGLLPERSFTELLIGLRDDLDSAGPLLENLWETMNKGGYSLSLRKQVLRFNGGMFQDASAIKIDKSELELLIEAASSDWRHVEPAIFGTLLERALEPSERHKLGAHFTPRSYVERLVVPTVIKPLRDEWVDVQALALSQEQRNKQKDAIETVKAFHHKLTTIKILDPACGSGNFLYVTLELMKRLEGEVLEVLEGLKGGQMTSIDADQVAVDPHQFLGIEINPRAARIAEIVLWIGYLQWHFKTTGKTAPPDPVLRDYKNIENRDALLSYDSIELMRDEAGSIRTRWDGSTTIASKITGEQVPDESAQVEMYVYTNPRKAQWPQADFIIGNPPYIGARKIRQALGDGYIAALRSTYPDIPEHVDFVMYWWAKASDAVGAGLSKNFGLITTNSLRQTFSRKVVDASFERNPGLGISFVIPDHPWVDSSDGAAVRVTMATVGKDISAGKIARVIKEQPQGNEEIGVEFVIESGLITPNLTIGVDPGKAIELMANNGIACVGFQLTGQGFVLDESQAQSLKSIIKDEHIIRPLMTGKDITQHPRGLYAIDLYGLSVDQVRADFPKVYQWVLERVKPERDQNNRLALRERWWIFGEARSTFRPALVGIQNVISTCLTAKHRIFSAVPSSTICDSTTVMFAIDDLSIFGVLCSRVHVVWSIASGGTLEDRPRYNKNRCFETFPFPEMNNYYRVKIAEISKHIDDHRKARLGEFPELTLTGLYNVLEKLRSGQALSVKEKVIHEHGLVSILKELHDELDIAVFSAYGWEDLASKLVGLPGATTLFVGKSDEQASAEEELLSRLVRLNIDRVAEEANGNIKWLRPEYQNKGHSSQQLATSLDSDDVQTVSVKMAKLTWPSDRLEQVEAIRLAIGSKSLPPDLIASQFKTPAKAKQTILEILSAWQSLGVASVVNGNYRLVT